MSWNFSYNFKKLTTENDYNNLIKLSSRLIDCKLDIFLNKPLLEELLKGIEKSAKSHIIIMASDLETNPSDLKNDQIIRGLSK